MRRRPARRGTLRYADSRERYGIPAAAYKPKRRGWGGGDCGKDRPPQSSSTCSAIQQSDRFPVEKAWALHHFLLAVSSFCLYILSASLRIVSATSLFPERFFKSWVRRFFINVRLRSIGVRGLATRFRTTM